MRTFCILYYNGDFIHYVYGPFRTRLGAETWAKTNADRLPFRRVIREMEEPLYTAAPIH
jgi:hypothetical protein